MNDAAKSAAPVTAAQADLDGDFAYEALEIRFATAPPPGTDNVEITWSARII